MSVGHIARIAEEAGIPTVTIFVKGFRKIAEEMSLPRVLITEHPVGRPLGAPGDTERQKAVVAAALDLLYSATEGGTISEFDGSYIQG